MDWGENVMSYVKMRVTWRRMNVEVSMLDSAIARAESSLSATDIYIPEEEVDARRVLAERRRGMTTARDDLKRVRDVKKAVLGLAESYLEILERDTNGPLKATVDHVELVNAAVFMQRDMEHFRTDFGEDGVLQPFPEIEREGLE
jgi:hypothetical protein